MITEPFPIHVEDEMLSDGRRRMLATRWPSSSPGPAWGWILTPERALKPGAWTILYFAARLHTRFSATDTSIARSRVAPSGLLGRWDE